MDRVETRGRVPLETARARERAFSALAAAAGAALLAASWALAACLRGCRPEACGAAAAALEDNIRLGVYGDELCGFPGKEKEEWRW